MLKEMMKKRISTYVIHKQTRSNLLGYREYPDVFLQTVVLSPPLIDSLY